ncbi:nucleoside triphosphate hydrolase [Marinobacterium rhizophilum]|uniref:nucleoside triphosphate hydrolase n=1 Tax=Marinobacterium rhizophilum TaxID=420402 RepID=UPI00035EEF72|nr:nucleoside triphosphate hydrolase [Marinobacterium rhizophilum]
MTKIDTSKIVAPESVRRCAAGLADRIEALPECETRRLVAIAGPPGSGKSTLAEAVVGILTERGHGAVLMPMDGFHLDDRLLEPRGLLARKGAPETFDFGGFACTLNRVRDECSVILPVFDRAREIAVAGAAEISAQTRIVIVEGNYLCFDEAPWRSLANLWDLSVFLDVPLAELEQRLIERWRGYGFDLDAARTKALGNDIPNARRVASARVKVDIVLSERGAGYE